MDEDEIGEVAAAIRGEDRPRPPPAPIWEPLPNEPDQAFEDFAAFLTASGSVAAWARETGRNPGTIGTLAARWRWRMRKGAYQAHLRACALEAAEAEAEEIGREHARAFALARELATGALSEHATRRRVPSIKDATALLKLAVEGERLIAGKATTKIEHDFSGLPLHVLDAMDALERGDTAAALALLADRATMPDETESEPAQRTPQTLETDLDPR